MFCFFIVTEQCSYPGRYIVMMQNYEISYGLIEKEIYIQPHIYREMDHKYGKMLTIGEFKWKGIWLFNVLIHSMYFIVGSEFFQSKKTFKKINN